MLQLSQTALSDQLQIGQASDPGRSGKNNEDYFGVFSVPTSTGECLVAAVADGIGGSVGGERASVLTITTMAESLRDVRYAATALGQRLDQAIRLANQQVFDQAQNDPALMGMGTTIVAAGLDGDRLYVVHAGDSRAYLIRGGRAHQLTLDHSWAQEAIEAGRITPDAAKTHPNRHVIRRYLGINEDVETDPRVLDPSQGGDPGAKSGRQATVVSPIMTRLGDAILLCSDGLTDEVPDEEIARIVSRYGAQEAAQRLVGAANAAGGADNITVVILQRGKGGGGGGAAPRRSRLVAVGLAVAGALIVGAAALLLANGGLLGGTPGAQVAAASVTPVGPAVEQGAALQAEGSPGTAPTSTPVALGVATPITGGATGTELGTGTDPAAGASAQDAAAAVGDPAAVMTGTVTAVAAGAADASSAAAGGSAPLNATGSVTESATVSATVSATADSTETGQETVLPATVPAAGTDVQVMSTPAATIAGMPGGTSTGTDGAGVTGEADPSQVGTEQAVADTGATDTSATGTTAAGTTAEGAKTAAPEAGAGELPSGAEAATSTPAVRSAQVYEATAVPPTSTPVMRTSLTATMTATPMPPRSTPAPPVSNRTQPGGAAASQSTAVATRAEPTPAAAASSGPQSIRILSPIDTLTNVNEAEPVTFSWEPNAALGANQVFELVFWQKGGGSPESGKAVGRASAATAVVVTPSQTAMLAPGDWQWGVWLAREEPYLRLVFLGEGGSLRISGSSSGHDDPNPSEPPSNPPPTK